MSENEMTTGSPRRKPKDGIWAKGFFVSTVGINEAVIRNYVRYQGEQAAG